MTGPMGGSAARSAPRPARSIEERLHRLDGGNRGADGRAVALSRDQLEDRAVELVARAQRLARMAIEEAWEAGCALQVVRDAYPPRSGYRAWLAEVGINRETDRRLRKLYELHPDMTQLVSYGSVAEALRPGRSARPGTGDNRGDPRRDEWYSPERLVEAAREVMGSIDLDPASCADAQEVVRADRFYTVADDGLSQPWSGNVWLNPPYSRTPKRLFVERLIECVESGDVRQACVLTFSDWSPAWAEPLAQVASAVCDLRGRTGFWSSVLEGHAPGMGARVAYVGPEVERFAEAFVHLGMISVTHTETRAGIMPTTIGRELLRIDEEIARLRLAVEVQNLLGGLMAPPE